MRETSQSPSTGLRVFVAAIGKVRLCPPNVPGRSDQLNLRILIVDDHEFVLRGVGALIKDNRLGTVCGEAADGEEAVLQAIELQPDLIIMDISMPRLAGIEATKQIRTFDQRAKIIILTMHHSSQMAGIATNAGANRYVEKTAVGEQLAKTIRELFTDGQSEGFLG